MMTLKVLQVGALPSMIRISLKRSIKHCSRGVFQSIIISIYLRSSFSLNSPSEEDTRQAFLLVVLIEYLRGTLLRLVMLIVAADWNWFLQNTIAFQGYTTTSLSASTSLISLLLLLYNWGKSDYFSMLGISIFRYIIISTRIYLSTMNTFGVSLFKEPEEFVALHLGLKTHTHACLSFLERLLHRTKSPPLAITYTYHFLKDKTEEELSLDIIRFVSQLADVSPGVSMNSSLQDILSESSFLTELRHSLTHKTMVKGTILLLGRRLILQELQQKYWVTTCNKIRQVYRLNPNKVAEYFRQIYKSEYDGDLGWLVASRPLEYFAGCSNYEYKQHIGQVIQAFIANRLSSAQFEKYGEVGNSQKQTIFVVVLLQTYITLNEQQQHFTHFLTTYLQQLPSSVLQQQLVKRELLKCYFLKYLKHAQLVVQSLPSDYQQQLEQFWSEKEQQIGKIYS